MGMRRPLLIAAVVLIAAAGTSPAQQPISPPPGAIYREYTRVNSGDLFRVTDPNATNSSAAEFLPNPQLPLTIDDLQRADGSWRVAGSDYDRAVLHLPRLYKRRRNRGRHERSELELSRQYPIRP